MRDADVCISNQLLSPEDSRGEKNAPSLIALWRELFQIVCAATFVSSRGRRALAFCGADVIQRRWRKDRKSWTEVFRVWVWTRWVVNMMTCIYCEDNECVESPQDSTLPSLSLNDIIFLSLSLTFQGFFFPFFFSFHWTWTVALLWWQPITASLPPHSSAACPLPSFTLDLNWLFKKKKKHLFINVPCNQLSWN